MKWSLLLHVVSDVSVKADLKCWNSTSSVLQWLPWSVGCYKSQWWHLPVNAKSNPGTCSAKNHGKKMKIISWILSCPSIHISIPAFEPGTIALTPAVALTCGDDPRSFRKNNENERELVRLQSVQFKTMKSSQVLASVTLISEKKLQKKTPKKLRKRCNSLPSKGSTASRSIKSSSDTSRHVSEAAFIFCPMTSAPASPKPRANNPPSLKRDSLSYKSPWMSSFHKDIYHIRQL